VRKLQKDRRNFIQKFLTLYERLRKKGIFPVFPEMADDAILEAIGFVPQVPYALSFIDVHYSDLGGTQCHEDDIVLKNREMVSSGYGLVLQYVAKVMYYAIASYPNVLDADIECYEILYLTDKFNKEIMRHADQSKCLFFL